MSIVSFYPTEGLDMTKEKFLKLREICNTNAKLFEGDKELQIGKLKYTNEVYKRLCLNYQSNYFKCSEEIDVNLSYKNRHKDVLANLRYHESKLSDLQKENERLFSEVETLNNDIIEIKKINHRNLE